MHLTTTANVDDPFRIRMGFSEKLFYVKKQSLKRERRSFFANASGSEMAENGIGIAPGITGRPGKFGRS